MLFLHCNTHSNSSQDDSYQVKVKRKVGTLAATFVNNSAPSLQPYMKLMRIDKPIGTNSFYILNFMPDRVKLLVIHFILELYITAAYAAVIVVLTLWDENGCRCVPLNSVL
jgi:hypothetical protein